MVRLGTPLKVRPEWWAISIGVRAQCRRSTRTLIVIDGRYGRANAGYPVVYESELQFSWEYSRMFGVLPISDVAKSREPKDRPQVGGRYTFKSG